MHRDLIARLRGIMPAQMEALCGAGVTRIDVPLNSFAGVITA